MYPAARGTGISPSESWLQIDYSRRMLVTLLLSSSLSIVGIILNSDGLPLIKADQVLQCPNSAKDGPHQRSYKDGTRMEKGACMDGLAHGYWKAWHPNGNLMWKGDVVRGQFQGGFKSYWPDGSLRARGDMLDGAPIGNWKTWYDDGDLRSRGAYVEGGEEGGCWKTKYDGAGRASKGAYVDGEPVGSHYTWQKGSAFSVPSMIGGSRGKNVYGGSTTQGRCWWPLI